MRNMLHFLRRKKRKAYREELQEMYKKLNTCVECPNGPNGCPACACRIPTDELHQLVKDHIRIMDNLEIIKESLEIYMKE